MQILLLTTAWTLHVGIKLMRMGELQLDKNGTDSMNFVCKDNEKNYVKSLFSHADDKTRRAKHRSKIITTMTTHMSDFC